MNYTQTKNTMESTGTNSLSTPLGKAEKIHSDKGYSESTLEEAVEFAKKRNYHYTNTDNPIDFPEGFYDVGNLSLDEIKRKGRE